MRKGRVLIVDDEIGQYEVMRLYLDPLPLEVQVAEGTAQAIKMLSADRFDAVLCDLVMNGGGGLEVLRFIQSRGVQTPIIVVRARCRREGGDREPLKSRSATLFEQPA